MKLPIRWAALILSGVALMCSTMPAVAQEDDAFLSHWGVRLGLGGYSWNNLADVQPLGVGGPFRETFGKSAEGRLYASVGRLGNALVLTGMEVAFGPDFNDDSWLLEEDEPNLNSWVGMDHTTFPVSFRFGQPGGRYLEFDVGVGFYNVTSKYIDCAVIVRCFQADTDADAEGLYLGVTGMVGAHVVLGLRVHVVDFDPIEAIDLGVSPLKGPIYSFFIGGEFGNW